MIIQLTREEKRRIIRQKRYGYVHIPTRYFRCNDCDVQMMLYLEDSTEDTETRPGKRCYRCNGRNLRVEII